MSEIKSTCVKCKRAYNLADGVGFWCPECSKRTDDEEEEEKSEAECARCHEEYALRDGQEPTEFCDECAHKVIDELRAQLRAAQTEAEGAKAELAHKKKIS
jgi:uncharacterized Zn ribbon protein